MIAYVYDIWVDLGSPPITYEVQTMDLLKLLAAISTSKRGHRYIIDGLLNYEDWYLWFDAELCEDERSVGHPGWRLQ